MQTINVISFSGKVHGSLARAGKVKGQTPKVNSFYLIVIGFIYYAIRLSQLLSDSSNVGLVIAPKLIYM